METSKTEIHIEGTADVKYEREAIDDADLTVYNEMNLFVRPGLPERESYRVSTMKLVPDIYQVDAQKFAANGFYFNGRQVLCFSCKNIITSLNPDNDISRSEWHKPQCDFFHGRDSKNVPISVERVVNIIKTKEVDGETVLELDVEVLEEIFLHPDVADLPVAIYSIAGASRKGKSFLLNLFMRHLSRKKIAENNKIDISRETLDSWFGWKGGIERHTEGILILKEPYIIKVKDKNVALFLMDTQGLFDVISSMKNSSIIAALSFFMSSCQMFNLMNDVNANDLQYIYKLAKFAGDVKKSSNNNCSPFQSLTFLIRDWKNKKKYNYGYGGGKKYIDYILNKKKSAAEEHHLISDHVYSNFEEVACFLFPCPSDTITCFDEDDNVEECAVGEIGDGFLKNAEMFFESLCSSGGLRIKKHDKNSLTARQLFNHVVLCAPQILGGMKDIQNFILADVEAKMNNTVQSCTKHYMEAMCNKFSERTQDVFGDEQLLENHEAMKKQVLIEFDEEVAKGPESRKKQWRRELEVVLNLSLRGFQECIAAEREYKLAVEEYKSKVQSGWFKRHEVKLHKEVASQIIKDLKQKLHRCVADQCCMYFQKEAIALFKGVQSTTLFRQRVLGTVGGIVVGGAVAGLSLLFPPVLAAAVLVEIPTGLAIAGGVTASSVVGGAAGISTTTVITSGEDEKIDEEDNLNIYDNVDLRVQLFFGIVTISLKSLEQGKSTKTI